MTVHPDDEGLTWGGETDPTHVDALVEEPEPGDHPEGPVGISSPLLVTYGVFGGVFLLFVVGWIIGVQRDTLSIANPFFDFMYRLGEVLAIASPAAWFVGVLFLARDQAAWARILWLLLGVVLLAPWPFILVVGRS
ncbi:hypothetical protein [Lacisediminihabitans profunda]|uniref:DNA polymerase III subunit gamma/tau n=1 Tax=Lacisediminihabitans profunda TaxID=2594790 RepID=A0A5C8UNM8_9MICO|nr:hypothetical protein [Lacisediminihabitans profunda]TXN30022.1 hypothetical protein FVP33_12925 [Lacisediminihabitans profunda]